MQFKMYHFMFYALENLQADPGSSGRWPLKWREA